ncbi:SCF ubiquitin ligase complex subunit [Paecilomyces lecythidis]|uniref:SCF ubiquitin ligase complex subunit n=1 Tax=Paecilomyces lecythidis TaxID=3004212 RepID=A0ABR3Y9C0_9EURO
MLRSRPAARFPSEALSESSSSTSPERAADDDTDFFMAQANDSQSSVGVTTIRDGNTDRQDAVIPPIGRLPPEILIAIFSKLNSTADMLNCMLVCQGWAANCVGILWHRPSCNKWDNLRSVVTSVGKGDGLFPYSELVKRLNLSALTEKVSDGTVVPFTQCKRIERLTLTNCSKLTDKGVSDLVEGNRHLQALDVSELRSLTDHTLFTVAKNCPRLQGLNITGCVKVTDDSLVAVSGNCRQIKRLKLNGVVQVTDKSVLSFSDNCPSILEIDLHDCKLITNTSVTSLLSSLRNLRELRLAHCTEINDSAFLNLPEHLVFDSLRILDLTACENVKDDAVERIVNSAPRLRNLVLAKCRFVTDRTVQAICKLGKNLHYVHLGHCSNITDAAVIQLVKSCNRIRYIDLACCNRLTDASVQQLATLPKLRRIGLVKCQAITDRSILALARPKISPHPLGVSSLERVHLSYCVNLTMDGIHALLNHCPRLTHLSLTGVQAFLREELTAFCREAPPEFTQQQREVFCVFSGEGVSRLRDFLNRSVAPFHEDGEATMYDDDEELDEEEGQVTGLMNATAINDEEDDELGDGAINVPHPHG